MSVREDLERQREDLENMIKEPGYVEDYDTNLLSVALSFDRAIDAISRCAEGLTSEPTIEPTLILHRRQSLIEVRWDYRGGYMSVEFPHAEPPRFRLVDEDISISGSESLGLMTTVRWFWKRLERKYTT